MSQTSQPPKLPTRDIPDAVLSFLSRHHAQQRGVRAALAEEPYMIYVYACGCAHHFGSRYKEPEFELIERHCGNDGTSCSLERRTGG